MKISELGIKEHVNEGVFDNVKDKVDYVKDKAVDTVKKAGVWGWSSTERGANKQSVISKQQDEKLKRYGQKDFYNKLSSSLKAAVASGVVAPTTLPTTANAPISVSHKAKSGNPNLPPANTLPPVSNTADPTNPNIAAQKAYTAPTDRDTQIRMAYKASIAKPDTSRTPADKKAIKLGQSIGIKESKKIKQYELFSRVVESRILTESESVSKFIQDFVGGQTREFVRNPSYSENIKLLADQIEAKYDFNTKQIDSTIVNKIWETLWAWSKLGKKQSGYGQFIDMDHDGTPDAIERERDRKALIKKINNTDFNDKDELKKLSPEINALKELIDGIP